MLLQIFVSRIQNIAKSRCLGQLVQSVRGKVSRVCLCTELAFASMSNLGVLLNCFVLFIRNATLVLSENHNLGIHSGRKDRHAFAKAQEDVFKTFKAKLSQNGRWRTLNEQSSVLFK